MGGSNSPVVEIRGLSKVYGIKTVLNNIDLDVYPGQIIGYIGPNGAGKTTTIKILVGIIEKFSGDVKILGEDIRSPHSQYKYRVGYVPESGAIYESLTAFEYLSFIGNLYGLSPQLVEDKIRTMMKLLSIEGAAHSRISSLSKGMKQKVLIIASLINNPDIMFFDEPLNGLDANSVMIFKEVMASLSTLGKTIFYSSHILDVVERISSRIILINKGEIVAAGTFQQLREKNNDSSLESIFNQLTDYDKHAQIARQFVEAVQVV